LLPSKVHGYIAYKNGKKLANSSLTRLSFQPNTKYNLKLQIEDSDTNTIIYETPIDLIIPNE
jgi:hypothetical protein